MTYTAGLFFPDSSVSLEPQWFPGVLGGSSSVALTAWFISFTSFFAIHYTVCKLSSVGLSVFMLSIFYYTNSS